MILAEGMTLAAVADTGVLEEREATTFPNNF
jgi:hypothetical protein